MMSSHRLAAHLSLALFAAFAVSFCGVTMPLLTLSGFLFIVEAWD